MTIKKIFPARAITRGNVESGLKDYAFIITRSHSQWSRAGLTLNVDDRLVISLDGGATSGTINLTNLPEPFTIDDIVAEINTQFLGIGVVAFAADGGYLLIRSFREGIGSEVDITGSDATVLSGSTPGFQWDETLALTRKIEDTPEHEGPENNPLGTRLVGQGEQFLREHTNRPAIALFTNQDRIQGFINREYAVPVTSALTGLTGLATKTLNQMSNAVYLRITIAAGQPFVDENLVGDASGTTGTIGNVTPAETAGEWWVAVPSADAAYNNGETFTCGTSGATGTIQAVVSDDRIRAVKMPDKTFVGGFEYFGGALPTPDQLEHLFQFTNFHAVVSPPVPNGLIRNQTPGAPGVPSGSNRPVRVRNICAGEPTDAFSITAEYLQQGVLRQDSTGITSWTKNKIYPNAMSANVAVGDILEISGSVDGAVNLNNGNYCIIEVAADHYVVGPSLPAKTSSGMPEEILEDAEIFEKAATAGVSIRVLSPSYYLDQRADNGAVDRSCWLFLEEPATMSSSATITYYRVTNAPDDHVGRPQTESPSARFGKGLAEDVERQVDALDINTFHVGNVGSGRNPILNALSTTAHEFATVDEELHIPDADVLRQTFSPIRSVLARYTEQLNFDTAPADGQLSTVAIINQSKIANTVGPVENMWQRHIDTPIQEFSYTTTASGHPPEGTTLTGTLSGATILSVKTQEVARSAFLGKILSGYPIKGEEFTWNAGGDNILNIGNFAFVGFVLSLPDVASGDTHVGTIAQGSAVVSLGGTGLPEFFDQIRPGDLFWATSGPMATNSWKARVQSTDSTARTITLEVPQPYAGAGLTGFSWRITPSIGPATVLSGTDASCVAGTNFVHINTVGLTEPNPYDHGVGPGDLLKASSGADGTVFHRPIKRIFPRPGTTASNYWIVELEETNGALLDASSVAWEIISTHTRVSAPEVGSFDSYWKTPAGVPYDGSAGNELWLVNGPGYIRFPIPAYDGTNVFGGPASGINSAWTGSGLSGKSLTVELLRGAEKLDEMVLTFSTNPTLPENLEADFNALIAGQTQDWLTTQFVQGVEASFVIRTTARPLYNPPEIGAHGAVGPGISLYIHGEAWDVLTSGAAVEYGNVSDAVYMVGMDEFSQHIIPSADFSWDFQWQGALTKLDRNVEIGKRGTGAAIFTAMDQNAPLVNIGDHSRQLNAGNLGATNVPSLAFNAPRQGHRTEGHKFITAGDGTESVYMTHDGQVGSRARKQVLKYAEGTQRGKDAFGSYGQRPPEIHSGPISFFRAGNVIESWHGHTLTLVAGYGKTIQRIFIDFTATEDSLDTVIAKINAALVSASVNGWLECVLDSSHTGFLIRFKPVLVGPHYHERTFLAVDPSLTTLGETYLADERTAERYRELNLHTLPATFSGHRRGMEKIFGRTSVAEARGAAEGLIEDKAAGRRLIVPRHRDGSANDAATGYPSFEEVIWEEVAGSIQHMFGRDMDVLTSQDEKVNQPESYIWYAGSKGPGKLMLYQFNDTTAFSLGESVGWNDENVNPGGIDSFTDAQVLSVATANANKGIKSRTKEVRDIRVQILELAGHDNTAASGTLTFNSGGTQLTGETSGAKAFYNPTVVRLENIQNEPTWLAGEEFAFGGGAKAYFAERFTINADVFYVLMWSDNNWRINVGTDPTSPLSVIDLFRTATSVDHGTFSAVVMEAYIFNSNVLDGGAMRPVAALANKSFNPYDEHLNKPAVVSFGDMLVPKYGAYLFGDRLPKQDHSWYGTKEQYLFGAETGVAPAFPVIADNVGGDAKRFVVFGSMGGEWEVKQIYGAPLQVGDTIATAGGFQLANILQIDPIDKPVHAIQMAEQGRTFTTEVLADSGHAIEAMDTAVASFQYPGQTGGLEDPITLNFYTSGASTAKLTYFNNLGPETKGVAFRAPNTAPPEGTYEYYGTTFHVPTPGGYVWLEGFGAYVFHKLPGVATFDRPPLVVSLHMVGGQTKNSVWSPWYDGDLNNDGYLHRLEVKNTAAKVMRVDSAGRGSIYDESASKIPGWASGNIQVTRGGEVWPVSRWGFFKPFPLWMFNEHTVELYVEPIGAGVAPDNDPDPGFTVINSDATGTTTSIGPHPNSSASLAYVEKYQTNTEDTGDMYRFIVYNGPSMNNKAGVGYPDLILGGAKTFPPQSQGYPGAEGLFQEGQIIRWSSGTGYGIGRVRHLVTYPHGANLRIMVHLNHGVENGETFRDAVAGVFVRYRTDRVDLSRT